MLMIKGTSVLLGSETVGNVLIGEPSADGRELTLAIPKGDTRNWADKIVTVRGHDFRTIGLPQQGMEENIPLCWNKKVRIKQLVSTGGCTVYRKGSYERHFYNIAEVYDRRGSKCDKTGTLPADDVSVFIPSCCTADGYVPKVGDIIVNGEQDFTFDTSTEQKLSESMAAFRSTVSGSAVISSVTPELNGALFDYTITAR